MVRLLALGSKEDREINGEGKNITAHDEDDSSERRGAEDRAARGCGSEDSSSVSYGSDGYTRVYLV